MRWSARAVASTAVAITALMLVGGLVLAAIPGPSGVLAGCYDRNGNVRVVDSSASCPKGWTAVAIASQAGLDAEELAREAGDADTLDRARVHVTWNASNVYQDQEGRATLTSATPTVAFPLDLPASGQYVLIAAGTAVLREGSIATTAGCTWGSLDGDTYGGDGSYAAFTLTPDIRLASFSSIWMAYSIPEPLSVEFRCQAPAFGPDSGGQVPADSVIDIEALTISAIEAGAIEGPTGRP